MYGKSRYNWDKVAKQYSQENENKKRLRIYFGRAKHTPDDVRPLVNLLKKASHITYVSNYSNNYFHNSFINSSKQQCVVKFRYSDNIQAHAKYLKNYMVQKDKEEISKKPELFGNVSTDEYISRMDKEKKTFYKNGKMKTKTTSKHFKWILTPEENLSEEVLKEYTKCFIQRLEQITGYKFVWQAAVHQNTKHNHVHLLINGVDLNGKRIDRFSKDIIKNYAREFSQEILTNICGYRSNELKKQARTNRIYAERFTEFDKKIQSLCIKEKDSKFLGYIGKDCGDDIFKRLEYLESINLAEVIDGKFYIKKDFEERLKNYGKYNTFREAQSLVKNGEAMKLYLSEMGEIKGTIRKVYSMNDEDIWNNAMVIENEKTGESFFVPSFNPITLKPGQNIKVVPKKDPKGGVDRTTFKDIDIVKKDDGTWSYGD